MPPMTPRGLLRAVRRYCRTQHVTIAHFGRKTVHNAQFAADLQKGLRPRRRTAKAARSVLLASAKSDRDEEA